MDAVIERLQVIGLREGLGVDGLQFALSPSDRLIGLVKGALVIGVLGSVAEGVEVVPDLQQQVPDVVGVRHVRR